MKQRRRDCALISRIAAGFANCLLLLLALLSVVNTAFADASPRNLAPRWLSLGELKEKWANVSLDALQRAADSGDLTAEHYLGYCYAEGLRFAKNPSLGISYYERAAKAGYVPSWNNLGVLYQKGKIVPQDFARAIHYYRLAADAGLDQARANLGFAFRDGIGVQRDPQEAMKWFQLAAAQGHAGAMVEIGRSYRFGIGVPKDLSVAKVWFAKAATNGSALASLNLGLLYDQDEDDPVKAISFYRQSADRGDAGAMSALANIYFNGRGVDANEAEGLKWLIRAAETGDADAEYSLASYYENPHWLKDGNRLVRLLPENMPEALKWYRLSAEQDWAGGKYHLGLCYVSGKGVDQDEEKGLDLIRQAADQHLAYAELDLADLYARGIGEPRNDQDRPIALLQSVVKSDPQQYYAQIKDAYNSLIFRYDYGVGTQRDVFTAVQWYCRAALAGVDRYTIADKINPGPGGHPEHQSYRGWDENTLLMKGIPMPSDRFYVAISEYFKAVGSTDHSGLVQIGERYLSGRGVPQSASRAWLWFSLAAQSGAPGASNKISAAEAHMTEGELAQARQQLPEMVQDFNSVAAMLRTAR